MAAVSRGIWPSASSCSLPVNPRGHGVGARQAQKRSWRRRAQWWWSGVRQAQPGGTALLSRLWSSGPSPVRIGRPLHIRSMIAQGASSRPGPRRPMLRRSSGATKGRGRAIPPVVIASRLSSSSMDVGTLVCIRQMKPCDSLGCHRLRRQIPWCRQAQTEGWPLVPSIPANPVTPRAPSKSRVALPNRSVRTRTPPCVCPIEPASSCHRPVSLQRAARAVPLNACVRPNRGADPPKQRYGWSHVSKRSGSSPGSAGEAAAV